ncbi:MAG TPA: hypothetical protein VLJ76_04170 [Gaiellaceae bacterium]|nr:hypothetical protein [Gaiellaceae bacterium]
MEAPRGFLGLTHNTAQANFGGDISGAAGPHDYVQTINTSIGIFSRSGTLLCPAVDVGTLWRGVGTACQTVGFTDSIVLFDRQAGRWLITRFAAGSAPQNPNWFECVAVSKTSDPTGGYFRYTFPISSRRFLFSDDYPKLGIWRDAYYLTANARPCCPLGDIFGIFVTAFDRSAMLNGNRAKEVEFFIPRNAPHAGQKLLSTLQPANVDGPTLPPAGTPEFLVQPQDDNMGWPADLLAVWSFRVDWSHPGSSKLAITSVVPVAGFDSNVCQNATDPPAMNQFCIVQRGTSDPLDPIAYGFSGYRLVYRRFARAMPHLGRDVLVFAQTVGSADNTRHTAIGWYAIGRLLGATAEPWFLMQEGTYSPDANDRWLPSPGIDAKGDIAIGFNVSGPNLFPSVRYAGRRVTDPPGQLPRHESTEALGGGSQIQPTPPTPGNPHPADNVTFGDYNQMVMDPTSDCRFWFTASFYRTRSDGTTHRFSTAVGSFRFQGCTS